MIKNIICFAGERKSGKDHLADFLRDAYGVQRLSFSDEVRRIADFAFPWLNSFQITPEVKDDPYIHPLNEHNLTPRQIWLKVGELRTDVEGGIFVRQFEQWQLARAQANPNVLHVITDFRTPQEFEFLKKHGIPIIKIIREDRTGIEPCDFEEYIRNFDNHQGVFINKMNGNHDFNQFIQEFVWKQDLVKL